MILTIKYNNVKLQGTSYKRLQYVNIKMPIVRYYLLYFFPIIIFLSSCGIYTFKDVSIPPEVKTIKISYIENKARIVNPQLSPRLTDALQQKISNQTKLTRTTSDDAHYQISGAITNYS